MSLSKRDCDTKTPNKIGFFVIFICHELTARKKKYVLICHDNDEVGEEVLQKWQSLYPHARAYSTPIGKDIGEAIQHGLKLRQWLIDTLPEDLQNTLRQVNLCWSKEDQCLLDWFSDYLGQRAAAVVPTRYVYASFEREIALGPDSSRAKTGELQDGLWHMKGMVEQYIKKQDKKLL